MESGVLNLQSKYDGPTSNRSKYWGVRWAALGYFSERFKILATILLQNIWLNSFCCSRNFIRGEMEAESILFKSSGWVTTSNKRIVLYASTKNIKTCWCPSN